MSVCCYFYTDELVEVGPFVMPGETPRLEIVFAVPVRMTAALDPDTPIRIPYREDVYELIAAVPWLAGWSALYRKKSS